MEPIILPRISDQKPLVSVVSITYNHEPYIRDCLEGFLMQKTNFPVEVIIHDDASTDHTADIIREYYEKRPDLFHVIIERENCFSKHKPIMMPLYEMAQGKYIALCEGDDYWIDPLKLQKQYNFMESHPDYSCCFHNAIVKNERTKTEKVFASSEIKSDWPLKDVILAGGGLMPTMSMFFRSEHIKDFLKFRYKCPVGDAPLSFCLANKGIIFYDHDIMSVYRYLSLNSWSSRIRDSHQTIEHLRKLINWYKRLKNSIIPKEKDVIEIVLSWTYSRYYFASRRSHLFLRNKYCRAFFKRMNFISKVRVILWYICFGPMARIIKTDLMRRIENKCLGLETLIEYDKKQRIS